MGRIFKTLIYHSFWSLYKVLGCKKSTTIFLTWILYPSYICIKNRKRLSKNFRFIKLALFFLFLAFTFLCSKLKGKLHYYRNSITFSFSYLCSVTQSCPWSLPGSSVHGISQARVLEWVAIYFFRGSSSFRAQTHISCVSCISWQIFF